MAASREYDCQQCEKNFADKTDLLESNEHKIKKEMWYCEACAKDININFKSSHIKSSAHIKKHFNFRINTNLNDEKYVFDEPNNNQ